ncbi:hypothetical protein [Elizabethkingia anophelis]|uniref:hypothetical protein n=1 Tax=Elizabethkingia anophelis TaxID=1117645 RepID=UPI003786FFCB
MTDFVLNSAKDQKHRRDKYDDIYSYADFLKQPLALWMVVPCDENNVPLEFIEYEAWTGSDEEYNKHTHKYFEAKERVLFEGFEIEMSKNRVDIYLSNYNHISYSRIQNNFSSPSKLLTTIEDLVMYSGLTLTETAIKSIYEQ